MPKWFNVAGPCKADIHYMLPLLARLPQLSRLVVQQGYFVIHAPRQTGKTTAMLALAEQLTASGDYTAIMVSAEVGAVFSHDPGMAERAMLSDWWDAAFVWLPPELHPPQWTDTEPGRHIGQALSAWAQASPRPLVVGSDRMDLCLRYGDVTVAMELEAWREGRPDPAKAGLAQLDRYLAGLGLDTGWLVIFDRRPGQPPISERTTTETVMSPSVLSPHCNEGIGRCSKLLTTLSHTFALIRL